MKTEKKYHGVVVPMVTPVTGDGNIDTAAVERIVSNFAKYGVSPLIMGTTGEGNSVSVKNGVEMISAAKRAANEDMVIYAGLAGNCISEQKEAAARFIEAGADVIAATLPCYYALTPEQMYGYYKDMADTLTVPLMLYNITITTHMSIPMDIIEKLSHHPNIVGLKDSENNVPRLEEALKLFAGREDFAYFCGCAANSAVALKNGADGIVPSVGNYLPKIYQDLYEAGVKGDMAKAEELQQKTIEIGKINTAGLTLGESLAGLKVIMNEAGLCETNMLPPLTVLDAETEERIRKEARPVIEQYN
ncbi:dihydrodipicolinate synthase family protein [Prevotella sp. PCHR]|uniref:Dihydrodipicolinate synthase family protein n=1 Tax=Xylanibacter caecicola TaxID=2736294 RepID=A0ABX2B045_9BACT|nr:dihydrodipicolinate synthase family protein [Xylanibacter caecicola]NPE24776.1 dihydrodipicolinate synthase family protein [Xylanibacter caecicola]